jgi:hypothetical protein
MISSWLHHQWIVARIIRMGHSRCHPPTLYFPRHPLKLSKLICIVTLQDNTYPASRRFLGDRVAGHKKVKVGGLR